MSKNTTGAVVAVIALVLIGGLVMLNSKDSAPATNTSGTTSNNNMNMENMPSEKSSTQNNDGAEDLTGQSEVTMDIKDFAFSKKSIKIKKGTKVTWTNQDSAKHNAFSDEANGPKGNLLSKGESYSFTFVKAGTINYYCEPHTYMKGIVNVIE